MWNVSRNTRSKKFPFEIFITCENYHVDNFTTWLVAKANGINVDFTKLLKESNLEYISHENMKESHIDEYDLQINRNSSLILAKNLIWGIFFIFFCFLDFNKEVNIDANCVYIIRFYDNLRPEPEKMSINLAPDEHEGDRIVLLKSLSVNYSNKVLIGQLNINSIENKLEVLSSMIVDMIDILMTSEKN